MKKGLANKLLTTYLAIILATAVSGFFCLFVLKMNKKSNQELRYVIMPSLSELKELKAVFQESKRLTNSWIVTSNSKDQERLGAILYKDYPLLSKNLFEHAMLWESDSERNYLHLILANDSSIIVEIKQVTELLNNEDAYLDDSKVDRAIDVYSNLAKKIATNDKLYESLISIINFNVTNEQKNVDDWLRYLSMVLIAAFLFTIVITFWALRFSQKYIINPIIAFNSTISDLANGDTVHVETTLNEDEIGQMHNAIAALVEGINQKINFADQIGKGNYNSEFKLLSEKDRLGLALLDMKNDLKASHEEILEQDKRLLDAQRLAKVGNYYFYANTMTFQSSVAFDEILGLDDTFDKVVKNWMDLILPEFIESVRSKASESITTGVKFNDQYQIRKYKTNEIFWVRSTGETIKDNSGKVIGIFGTLQDITESKLLEIEIQESYRLATEQNKRLSNFSYIVSHNLRMHAVNIKGLLSLLDDAESQEERDETIVLIKKAAGHLDETMHHLNDVVEMQNAVSVEIEPQLLNRHIEHAVAVLKTQIANKNVLIENNIPPETTVNYNSAYLESIVLNLISNAIKYSHPERQPVVQLDFSYEGGLRGQTRGLLTVTDNGIGIDMHRNGHKLFGMYKTFHNNKDAKGIGLFMTRYQVEAMGGEIVADSEPGIGTTFKVYFK